MIEVIAEGPIRVHFTDDIDEKFGHDHVMGEVTTTHERYVRVELELYGKDDRGGHVNLEGFSPSYTNWSVEECLGGYVSFPDEAELVEDEWEIHMNGASDSWIGAADRYLDERPGRTLEEVLKLFRRWDETDTDQLNRALRRVEETDVSDLRKAQ